MCWRDSRVRARPTVATRRVFDENSLSPPFDPTFTIARDDEDDDCDGNLDYSVCRMVGWRRECEWSGFGKCAADSRWIQSEVLIINNKYLLRNELFRGLLKITEHFWERRNFFLELIIDQNEMVSIDAMTPWNIQIREELLRRSIIGFNPRAKIEISTVKSRFGFSI